MNMKMIREWLTTLYRQFIAQKVNYSLGTGYKLKPINDISGIVLNRTEKRFRKNRPVSLIGPNAYLKDIHAEIEFEESYKPFANQSPRFPKPLKGKLKFQEVVLFKIRGKACRGNFPQGPPIF